MGGPDLAPIASIEAPSVDGRAIVAGAVVATGTSATLMTFGAAVGLSFVSAAPSWRESSSWLSALSGVYLLFVALCSFGFGGYVVGRMRVRLRPLSDDEIEFRDGMHGVIVWGLCIVMTAALAVLGVASTSRVTASSPSVGGASDAVVSESLLLSELDELFRTDRRFNTDDLTYHRAEAGRILLKSSSHSGVTNEDRGYLSSVTSDVTGIPISEAELRVNRAVAESKEQIHGARVSAVLQAFMIGASLLVGLAVSWFAATEGGREREAGYIPVWDWSWRKQYS